MTSLPFQPETPAPPQSGTRARPRCWQPLAGDPVWVLPTLVLLAALAGCAYAWGMGSQVVEVYYAAAVRSMSLSWHNFFFAAFDPAGHRQPGQIARCVVAAGDRGKVVRLPRMGARTPASDRGYPERTGALRYSTAPGWPPRGLAAAAVQACMPAAVALNRGNISDSLLLLLLLCATNAAARALVSGHTGPLLVAGLWVGLAFQAKMLEAWLVVPGLALVWLVAGSGSIRRRMTAVVCMGVLCAAVSLSWIAAVSLVPQQDRPYVDGSQHNSLFEQVFDYNGFGRMNGGAAPQTAVLAGGLQEVTLDAESTLNRTVSGPGGRDIGWLLPVAFVVGVATLIRRRRSPRRDLPRAGCMIFGIWFVADLAVFAASSTLNAYYLAALAPPISALIGLGSSTLVDAIQTSPGRRTVLALAVAAIGYETWLLSPAGSAIRVVTPLGALALFALALTWCVRGRTNPSLTALLASLLVAPTVASVSMPVNGWGPFDTPFEPSTTTAMTQQLPTAALRLAHASLARLQAAQGSARYMAATYTSLLAAPFIVESGDEVLPLGGFTGTIPAPTLGQLQAAIDAGDLHLVISPASSDPRVVWIARHCYQLPNRALPAYYCQAAP